VFTRFVQLFSILVITFFMVKDGHRLLNFIYAQLPPAVRKVFAKLGITSRRDLHNTAPPRGEHTPSAG
jgi:predicted PurR-regulated permease PerM